MNKTRRRENGEKNKFAANAATEATAVPLTARAVFAFAALAALALIAFSAQADAKLESTALIEFTFGLNATTGQTTLSLAGFETGLAELPYYGEPSSREFEVRLLAPQGTALRSIWFGDPRYVYYDFVDENGTLGGGRQFNANARFFVAVWLDDGARYAEVFDSKGSKLIAVDLYTGKTVEENNWIEQEFEPQETQATQWGWLETLAALAAAALLALVILGLVVFRKTSGGRKRA